MARQTLPTSWTLFKFPIVIRTRQEPLQWREELGAGTAPVDGEPFSVHSYSNDGLRLIDIDAWVRAPKTPIVIYTSES